MQLKWQLDLIELYAWFSTACPRLTSPGSCDCCWRGRRRRDALVGLTIASNVCCLLLGLTIITVFRLLKVPLLEGLPGG